MKPVYAVLCVLGIALPYWQFYPWLIAHGLNFGLFIDELFSTRIGAFFGMDVLVSAVVLLAFASAEKQAGHLRRVWPVVLALFAVGVSLALPLLLLMRESKSHS